MYNITVFTLIEIVYLITLTRILVARFVLGVGVMLPIPELVVDINKGTVSSGFESLLVVLLVILNREFGFDSSFLTMFTV